MLNAKALGLAGGVLWGLGMFVLTLLGMYVEGYGAGFYDLMMGLYPGYTLSMAGAFVGLVYGFIDAFIGLWIFGSLYNYFCGCCKKK